MRTILAALLFAAVALGETPAQACKETPGCISSSTTPDCYIAGALWLYTPTKVLHYCDGTHTWRTLDGKPNHEDALESQERRVDVDGKHYLVKYDVLITVVEEPFLNQIGEPFWGGWQDSPLSAVKYVLGATKPAAKSNTDIVCAGGSPPPERQDCIPLGNMFGTGHLSKNQATPCDSCIWIGGSGWVECAPNATSLDPKQDGDTVVIHARVCKDGKWVAAKVRVE